MIKQTFKCRAVASDTLYATESVTNTGGTFITLSARTIVLSKKQALRLAKLLIQNARGDDT